MQTPKAFKSYDIRGKYPEDVNEQFAEDIGASIASLVGSQIVVGRDNNTSSPSIKAALIQGILKTGTDVIDIGTGPTDMIAYAGKILNSSCSIMVTASHLGTKYNGFKFMYSEGNSFTNEDLAKIKETYMTKNYKQKESGHLTHDTDIYPKYLTHAKNTFKKYFRKIGAKIIIDTGDGACSHTTPKLLEELGAETIKINSDIDGNFRRHSDCSEQKNIAYLKDEIKKHTADLAIAHDLDGDRLAVLDKDGNWLSGNHLFAIFAHITAKHDTIIASIDTSELLQKTTQSKIIYTRVGDPFVLKALIDNNASLAGEPNGHYALREFIPYNSGTLFALLVAAYAKKIPLFIESMPQYHTATKKYTITDTKTKMRQITAYIRAHYTITSTIDGIKYKDNHGTTLIRPSGTENAIRIVREDRHDAQKKIKQTEKMLGL
ncbi:MAG: hypothetical protein U9Q92_04255 [archaeon]|nr:hypothetical protein [archaeon]